MFKTVYKYQKLRTCPFHIARLSRRRRMWCVASLRSCMVRVSMCTLLCVVSSGPRTPSALDSPGPDLAIRMFPGPWSPRWSGPEFNQSFNFQILSCAEVG